MTFPGLNSAPDFGGIRGVILIALFAGLVFTNLETDSCSARSMEQQLQIQQYTSESETTFIFETHNLQSHIGA
jgi:hypothetical protein